MFIHEEIISDSVPNKHGTTRSEAGEVYSDQDPNLTTSYRMM